MRTFQAKKRFVNAIWSISASQNTGIAKPRKLRVVAE